MYIKEVVIENIRTASHFKMTFPDPAGWHVLIGDNGTGKTTIIRAISLGLIGPNVAKALDAFQDWQSWLKSGEKSAKIELTISRENEFDKPIAQVANNKEATSVITLKQKNGFEKGVSLDGTISQSTALWGDRSLSGWFSVGYGPFRRLSGGNSDFIPLHTRRPRLGAHLSAFREDVALTWVEDWLKELALDAPRDKKKEKEFQSVVRFVNDTGLLPFGATLVNVDSRGLLIQDGNGVILPLGEMSDGNRSVLGVVLDILRYLIEIYGLDKVFNHNSGKIDLPGVVLIDEIDAHLHPTWQTRIGDWFLDHFPLIQFIITTHSPLICRAAHKGSIWRLAAPGSELKSGRVPDDEKDKLVYGNILDAYGTDVFGEDVERSKEGAELLERFALLSKKEVFGALLSNAEKKELKELKQIFTTDAPLAL
ncbi:MAG: hypothetical protein DYG98_08065 [Haliscomenobacteraceae bacterium CHB4]|nr:hypothetical protein [Haliscomenobacteraceae bacterium CHB4]